MGDQIIAVKDLSKRYVIGHQRNKGDALRHTIDQFLRSPISWLRARAQRERSQREDFWALKNVSFGVNRGDVVGVVGRNGAGKSTLLKILSRITEPTTGRITLSGRVASLLEVGTGFHQELTGRENIFLNGAILGMSKKEIARKFDEIVSFSEVEKFLDTPVKRYSSGMYVRLAFAVAAHLEPEILIVDEVLAVGDAAFQKKCLGKMGEVARGGRTVLFVSHNMGAVQALCNRAIYLEKGTVKAVGEVEQLLRQYHSDSEASRTHRFDKALSLGADLTLHAYEFEPVPALTGGSLIFKLGLRAKRATCLNEVSLIFTSVQGVRLAIVDLRPIGLPTHLAAEENWVVTGTIDSVPFVEGSYNAGIYVGATNYLENHFDLTTLSVESRPDKSGYAPYPVAYQGLINLKFSASIDARPSEP